MSLIVSTAAVDGVGVRIVLVYLIVDARGVWGSTTSDYIGSGGGAPAMVIA